jgi:hypothetical protein
MQKMTPLRAHNENNPVHTITSQRRAARWVSRIGVKLNGGQTKAARASDGAWRLCWVESQWADPAR